MVSEGCEVCIAVVTGMDSRGMAWELFGVGVCMMGEYCGERRVFMTCRSKTGTFCERYKVSRHLRKCH